MNKYKLAIVMRTDLGMSKGKMCVEVGHASVLAFCEVQDLDEDGVDSSCLRDWLEEGQFKVVLKCPKEERSTYEEVLLGIVKQAKDAGLPVVEVKDFGKTQVAPDTLTCIAIGPVLCEEVDKITKDLKLL